MLKTDMFAIRQCILFSMFYFSNHVSLESNLTYSNMKYQLQMALPKRQSSNEAIKVEYYANKNQIK